MKRSKPNTYKMTACKHCGTEMMSSSVGMHVISCHSNPRYAEYRKKQSDSSFGRIISAESREKSKNTINQKVEDGTWHFSFSKSRTIEYNGIKFYGSWEVAYAKWLDSQGIEWRRPTESFPYPWKDGTSRYHPDFYLVESKTYVEIKGWPTARDFAKWKHFPEKLVVLLGEELVAMGLLQVGSVRDLPPGIKSKVQEFLSI